MIRAYRAPEIRTPNTWRPSLEIPPRGASPSSGLRQPGDLTLPGKRPDPTAERPTLTLSPVSFHSIDQTAFESPLAKSAPQQRIPPPGYCAQQIDNGGHASICFRCVAAGRSSPGARPGLARRRRRPHQPGHAPRHHYWARRFPHGAPAVARCHCRHLLLVLNRTNWRTNVLTALLVPYLALQLLQPLFGYLRGDIGAWIAFVAVVIRLFFAQKYPELINGDMELLIAFILLVVTAPKIIVYARGTIISDIVSLLIDGYLLIQHTNSSGGFRCAFGETRGGAQSFGILLLFVAPAWALFKHII